MKPNLKQPAKRKPKTKRPSNYKVLLHNDDVNAMDRVVLAIAEIVHLPFEDAVQKMLEAHHTDVALLLVTHKELAELYVEQFRSKRLKATMEKE